MKFEITDQLESLHFNSHVHFTYSMEINDFSLRRHIPVLEIISGELNDERSRSHTFTKEKVVMSIQFNESLSFGFGFSVKPSNILEKIVSECLEKISNISFSGIIVSGRHCSSINFVPAKDNNFMHLSLAELIDYHKDLIKFQITFIKLLTEHSLFIQSGLFRCNEYRFRAFKDIRNNRSKLIDLYNLYINAGTDLKTFSANDKDIVESEIGCHFLGDPSLFYELINFSILQGKISNEST